MNGAKIGIFAGGLGLLSAVVALGAEVVGLQNNLEESKEKQDILIEEIKELREQSKIRIAEEKAKSEIEKEKFDQLIRAELRSKRESYAIDAQNRSCEYYMSSAQLAEDRFASLMQRRGTLITFVKKCSSVPQDEQVGCIATVCLTDYLSGDGSESCLSTLPEAAAIIDNIKEIRAGGEAQGCFLGPSPGLDFISKQ